MSGFLAVLTAFLLINLGILWIVRRYLARQLEEARQQRAFLERVKEALVDAEAAGIPVRRVE